MFETTFSSLKQVAVHLLRFKFWWCGEAKNVAHCLVAKQIMTVRNRSPLPVVALENLNEHSCCMYTDFCILYEVKMLSSTLRRWPAARMPAGLF